MGTHEAVECECGRLLLEANSCRYRFCPLCSVRRSNLWLAKWKARLLPVGHFHLVFTIPHELNFFWQRYPAVMGDIFFEAVSGALTMLLADRQWLGGRGGLLAMLQTWDNELKFHPHVHVLLTAGGANESGAWTPFRRGPKFLMPHLIISDVFRGKFMALVRKAEYSGAINAPAGWSFTRRMKFLKTVSEKAFVVQLCGPYSHGVGVLKYFASHVHGGPIANSRIVSVSRTLVTFRMKPRPELTDLECTLESGRFLERYLSHIPPPGFHIVRAYGLYSASSKVKVTGLPERPPKEEAIPDDQQNLCPRCRLPMVVRDRDVFYERATPLPAGIGLTSARASPMRAVA